ncbi:MAG TPA: hypothetical protein PLE33_08690 [Candidatus Cloacimonas sp.]|nr:hypothetical protein [Candidatus Cloacimonas sp.]HPS61318.1 hypothetical protein [Candidatus Cloacimonas sp.]
MDYKAGKIPEWVQFLRDAHEYKKHPHSDNPDKCIRCYEYKWIPYSLKLCDLCQEQLKESYPEVYEQSRLENIRRYDSIIKRAKTDGLQKSKT